MSNHHKDTEQLDELLAMESGWDVKAAIEKMTDNEMGNLLELVVPECQKFAAHPTIGGIGRIARYQQIKRLIEDRLAQLQPNTLKEGEE